MDSSRQLERIHQSFLESMVSFFLVLINASVCFSLLVRFVERKSESKSDKYELVVEGGTPPYKYDWDLKRSENGDSFIKKVIVTDSKGEKATTNSSVIELGVYLSVKNSTCSEGSGEMRADVIGGLMPYQYFWSNAMRERTITRLSQGEYCVAVKVLAFVGNFFSFH